MANKQWTWGEDFREFVIDGSECEFVLFWLSMQCRNAISTYSQTSEMSRQKMCPFAAGKAS